MEVTYADLKKLLEIYAEELEADGLTLVLTERLESFILKMPGYQSNDYDPLMEWFTGKGGGNETN